MGTVLKENQQVQFSFSFLISLSRFIYPTVKRERSEVGARGAHQKQLILQPEHPRLWGSKESTEKQPLLHSPQPKPWFPAEQSSQQPSWGRWTPLRLDGAGLGITRGCKFPNEMFAMVCEMTVCRRITFLVQIQRASTDPGEVFLLSAGSRAPSGPMPSSWRTGQKSVAITVKWSCFLSSNGQGLVSSVLRPLAQPLGYWISLSQILRCQHLKNPEMCRRWWCFVPFPW